jgi:large subunit ribosomal protein L21
MYAVFEDGSRQYVVNEDDVLRVDYREVEEGSTIEFDRVLLYKGDDGQALIGQPVIAGARIIAEVVKHPTEKVTIQHFRRRKNYRRFKGHRQPYTEVAIMYILKAGEQPPADEEHDDVQAGAPTV